MSRLSTLVWEWSWQPTLFDFDEFIAADDRCKSWHNALAPHFGDLDDALVKWLGFDAIFIA